MLIGLLATDYFKPGVGLNVNPNSLDAKEASSYLEGAHKVTNVTDLLINIIPRTFISAFVDGELLQVIFISILFAIGLILTGNMGKSLVNGMQILSNVFLKSFIL